MRKVIVIGGSAGAFQCLCDILKEFPASLPAAILAVIHTGQQSRYLTQVLQKCGAMPVIAQHSLAHDRSISDRMKKRHQENADAAKNDMLLLHQILARL